MNVLSKTFLLTTERDNRGLINTFIKEKAEGLKHYHVLNFRQIGETEYLLRVSYFNLKNHSTSAPNRRRSLQTFTNRKPTEKRISQLEKDQKLVLAAIKRKLLFTQKTGVGVDRHHEQLLQYPLSLSDTEGNPLTGQKSYFTKCLETRYQKAVPPIITACLPNGWKPQCSLLEGM